MTAEFLKRSPFILDRGFPLPIERPFTVNQSAAAGISSRQLSRLVAKGLLRRPARGVYVAAQVPDDRPLRGQILSLIVPPGSVVTDWAACWWWTGLDHPGSHLAIDSFNVFRVRGQGRLRNPVSTSGERWFLPRDLMPLDEHLMITTPLRTAIDLGRFQPRLSAIGGMDALAGRGMFGAGELIDELSRFKKQRGVVQLRSLAPIVDARSESMGESAVRTCWHDVPGLPPPELQIVVHRVGGSFYRVDLGLEELKFGVEYNGEAWHSSPQDTSSDKSRLGELNELHWTMRVLRRSNVFGQQANVERILLEGFEQALRRTGRSHYRRSVR